MLDAVKQRNLIKLIKDVAPIISEPIYNAIIMLIQREVVRLIKEGEMEGSVGNEKIRF